MASEHSDYIHGEMPTFGHDKTFKGFIKGSSFITAFLIVVLLMPILVFHSPCLLATRPHHHLYRRHVNCACIQT